MFEDPSIQGLEILPNEVQESICYQINSFCQDTAKQQCWNFIQKILKNTNPQKSRRIPTVLKELFTNLHKNFQAIFTQHQNLTVSKIQSDQSSGKSFNIWNDQRLPLEINDLNNRSKVRILAQESIISMSVSNIPQKPNVLHHFQEPSSFESKIEGQIKLFKQEFDKYLQNFAQQMVRKCQRQDQQRQLFLQNIFPYFSKNIVQSYLDSVAQIYWEQFGNKQNQQINILDNDEIEQEGQDQSPLNSPIGLSCFL